MCAIVCDCGCREESCARRQTASVDVEISGEIYPVQFSLIHSNPVYLQLVESPGRIPPAIRRHRLRKETGTGETVDGTVDGWWMMDDVSSGRS